MIVCRGVLRLPGNLSLADATGLRLPKGPGLFRNLCWVVLILTVKSTCICIPEKDSVRLFAAMPVLTLFTLKGKPRVTQVLGYQLVYSNVL